MVISKIALITAECVLSGLLSATIAKFKGQSVKKWFFYGIVFNLFAIAVISSIKNVKIRR